LLAKPIIWKLKLGRKKKWKRKMGWYYKVVE
jgi:hypothetical protein